MDEKEASIQQSFDARVKRIENTYPKDVLKDFPIAAVVKQQLLGLALEARDEQLREINENYQPQ